MDTKNPLQVATAEKPPSTNALDNDSDDDFTPPPREAFHAHPKLCHEMLRTVTTTLPLQIRSSTISMGSGLFLSTSASLLPAGREIYRSVPLLTAIDPSSNPNICHYCLSSGPTDAFGSTSTKSGNADNHTKACSACHTARFCSKNCEPNAFVFFEGNELRVRSLRQIAAGEEITVSYVDTNIDVAARREILQHEHFFECRCTRCKSERKEHVALLKSSKNLAALHQAQRNIITLMKNAVWAANHPGRNAQYEDLATVEAQLRTYTSNVFPSNWPDHIAPLPMTRMYLAALYINEEKLVPALRLALQGKLMSRCKNGPDWVNEMMDLMSILIVTGNIPPDSPLHQAGGLPTMDDTHAVTYGYLCEVCKEAGTAFGGDSKYTKAICDMFAGLLAKKTDARPGSKEFGQEFEEGQKKVLAWAGVPEKFGIALRP
ncbi:hypothetical protein B0T14DRAFT_481979 [Immersiella caudata]|uniref:SET domain-containing protein n=1 Tax=Immersiella caudata TaxID=314043 RepID=A0AA39WSP8_9PEZI|nr:hypothetical protein B0T14DRAFT_481979 [Immersiella caudata]